MPEFKPWPKITRWAKNEYIVTEKIDGTNAAVVILPLWPDKGGHLPDDNMLYRVDFEETVVAGDQIAHLDGGSVGVWAQSRNRFITPGADNYGFAKWVQTHARWLVDNLGVGYHHGEWWGQGIQRGYGMNKKMFSLFNPLRDSYVDAMVQAILDGVTLDLVPLLAVSPDPAVVQVQADNLARRGSVAKRGYMNPEGVMVYVAPAGHYYKHPFDPNPKG
jgi:hypothetical protein